MYQQLADAAAQTFSIDRGGQGFLSTFFRNRITWLHPRYNYLRHTQCILQYEATQGGTPTGEKNLAARH